MTAFLQQFLETHATKIIIGVRSSTIKPISGFALSLVSMGHVITKITCQIFVDLRLACSLRGGR